MMVDDTYDSIQVALRIRPLLQSEIDRACDECIDVVPGRPQVLIRKLAFTYNHVFAQHITQHELYDTAVKGLIKKLQEGYNVTLLAYGQSGSGKSYTMGTSSSSFDGEPTKLGVIPQAVDDIFDYIDMHQDQFIFRVNVSFMELYQEQCFDLLSGKQRAHSIIEIREDKDKGVILPNLSELPVASALETITILKRGSLDRMTASTAMNQASSRSHAVFTITIVKESRTNKNSATTSKLHLVDLAGSERLKKTKASGDSLKEGSIINKGLLALGRVISALGNGTKRSFISYRDSKLTRLLQDSLGGNSLTLMVACVSPADYNLDESVSTLRYANCVRKIRNKPIINKEPKSEEIVRLTNLVNVLRLELLGKPPTPNEQNIEQLQDYLSKEKTRNSDLMKKYKDFMNEVNNVIVENTNLCEKALLAEAAYDEIQLKVTEMTELCNKTIDNLKTNEKDIKVQAALRKTSVLECLKEIKERLEYLQSLNMLTNEDLNNHEIKVSVVSQDIDRDINSDLVLSEADAAAEAEKRTKRQVAIIEELHELNHAMAVKACTIQAILANNKAMLDSHENLQEYDDKIARLEKKREKLMQQTKVKDPSYKEQCTKVSAVEAKITDLKKKCQHQANVIKEKEENEAQIVSLNAEVQAMKATKIKIVRQMREETEKCKVVMLRLRTEDRPQAKAMTKMETLLAKHQNDLKRKMEGAVAINKRLKEALERQKILPKKRNAKGGLKAGAIQHYIEQELNVHLSVMEAEWKLEELREYRFVISEQIKESRMNDEPDTKRLAELEDDLTLRKAQITDLEQMILAAEQATGNNSCTQWDNIQSMVEAKVGLKYLFEQLINSKRDLQNQCESGYQARYEELKEAHERLALDYENTKDLFESQLAAIKEQSEQKMASLVALQHWRDLAGAAGGVNSTACQKVQKEMQHLQERLAQLEEENVELKRRTKIEKKKETVVSIGATVVKDDDEVPDCSDKPLMKRIKGLRHRISVNIPPTTITTLTCSDKSSKRNSDVLDYCTCRGMCSPKMCRCVKAERVCTDACPCNDIFCLNRSPISRDKNKNYNLSIFNTPPPPRRPS